MGGKGRKYAQMARRPSQAPLWVSCGAGTIPNRELCGHEHLALRAQCRDAVVPEDAAAQLDDISFEPSIRRHAHLQPFQANRFVGVDQAATAHPECEPHHSPVLRVVRGRQPAQQGRRVGAAGDQASVARRGGKRRGVVHGIGIARRRRIGRHHGGGSRHFHGEPFMGICQHTALLTLQPLGHSRRAGATPASRAVQYACTALGRQDGGRGPGCLRPCFRCTANVTNPACQARRRQRAGWHAESSRQWKRPFALTILRRQSWTLFPQTAPYRTATASGACGEDGERTSHGGEHGPTVAGA